MEEQEEFESVKLWRHVSDAIDKEDQHAATEQKSILEEAQRAGARERKANEQEWVPRFFELVSVALILICIWLIQKICNRIGQQNPSFCFDIGPINRPICLPSFRCEALGCIK